MRIRYLYPCRPFFCGAFFNMIGFDYGTSNCAMAYIKDDAANMVNLGEHGKYMASSLYAPCREIIVNWLDDHLTGSHKQDFAQKRAYLIGQGKEELMDLKLDGIDTHLSFGRQALDRYLDDPSEGYYIKSPKSFLGSTGLKPQQIAFFEHLVAAMMLEVKLKAEQNLDRELAQVVIGRPINFQGQNAQLSNQQAISVLTNAAKSIGFKDVEFQYEPVAAGLEYEAGLQQEQVALVVDIGGGTTDCSMILMSPEKKLQIDRQQDLLGHSGKRIGGNDFDIQLAMKKLMPNLGSASQLLSGKPMPSKSYFNAVAINDLYAQSEFYSSENGRFLKDLVLDAAEPELLKRLLDVYKQRLSYQLVNNAEQAKIKLSDNDSTKVDLSYLADSLEQDISRLDFFSSTERELNLIADLMTEAIEQAGKKPDVIFVTGGTARSPVIHDFLTQTFDQTPVVIGDHFGSVTAGLARWSQRIFS